MTTVKLRRGESQESLLKRFRKDVGKARILSAVCKKRWFVSKSELRRRNKEAGHPKGQAKARKKEKEAAMVRARIGEAAVARG